jgi:hypothetical protein
MTASRSKEESAMAISFPAPEGAAKPGVLPTTGERTPIRSLRVAAGDIVRRCYQRASAAIFDGDGDCMRL